MRLVRRQKAPRSHSSSICPDATPSLASLQVTAGPMLCRLHIWTEQEWEALADRDRPVEFVHVPGLGWVGALPLECMN
ncbi:hypothetical protein Sinac_6388 [Singulisphaera acidiphila DSM 18658]|uniref:Uncharacterized protein n=1 Tax=Singulisphaera acidiphila (strain ATCC BAA-1392 / DSM 18658 / VKM B-2454 / MOB10) TaxID=886293 RepID=L0DNP3_SINAD|nr:hypothetical protein Sinac_6388 [Singulisphaera acidiphila DSM 18658]